MDGAPDALGAVGHSDLNKIGLRPQLHDRRRGRLQRPGRARHARPGHDRGHRHRQPPLPGRGHGGGEHRSTSGPPRSGRATTRATCRGWSKPWTSCRTPSECGSAPPEVINISGGAIGDGSDRHGFHVEKARRQGLDQRPALRGLPPATTDRRTRRSGARLSRRTPSPSATCSTTATSRSGTSRTRAAAGRPGTAA